MPFNEKNEWVDPPENFFDKKDQELGYSVCACGEGVFIHQAGFDCDMHMCAVCRKMVADKTEFFKFQDGVEWMSK